MSILFKLLFTLHILSGQDYMTMLEYLNLFLPSVTIYNQGDKLKIYNSHIVKPSITIEACTDVDGDTSVHSYTMGHIYAFSLEYVADSRVLEYSILYGSPDSSGSARGVIIDLENKLVQTLYRQETGEQSTSTVIAGILYHKALKSELWLRKQLNGPMGTFTLDTASLIWDKDKSRVSKILDPSALICQPV